MSQGSRNGTTMPQQVGPPPAPPTSTPFGSALPLQAPQAQQAQQPYQPYQPYPGMNGGIMAQQNPMRPRMMERMMMRQMGFGGGNQGNHYGQQGGNPYAPQPMTSPSPTQASQVPSGNNPYQGLMDEFMRWRGQPQPQTAAQVVAPAPAPAVDPNAPPPVVTNNGAASMVFPGVPDVVPPAPIAQAPAATTPAAPVSNAAPASAAPDPTTADAMAAMFRGGRVYR